ncbi:MAG: (2Fe-2S)-binding protein, partial [Pseudomonadota bacterium]|nr:(2Fe-2S)-binding protein [Pseudomonadota bacterium]
MWLKRLRLGTGLVLATYVVLHLSNHALGLLSLEAMEGMRRIVTRLWSHPLGLGLLYGAFLTHYGLGLWSLYRRDHLRLRPWELAQLASGLLIPLLLLSHVFGTRMRDLLTGVHMNYPQVVTALWTNPWPGIRQVLALLIVWGHLLLGLHFWLRLKRRYRRSLPWLYPLAVLLPVLALLGFARAGMTVQELAATPGWIEELYAPVRAISPQDKARLDALESIALAVMVGALVLVLLAREARRRLRNRSGVFRLRYPSGKMVESHVGATMLEAIRAAGLPHAAVCGGRGRCTTCRVRVGAGREHLEPPNDTEARALRRIGAPPGVRLACQVRPHRDVEITPLLLASAGPEAAWQPQDYQGRE